MPPTKTREEFITQVESFHGKNRYDYSQVVYKNCITKVIIKCNVCLKIFEQTPSGHTQYGCSYCGRIKANTLITKTLEKFIDEAKNIHGDKYDYSYVKYINSDTNVTILHNICDFKFEQTPYSHIKGHGCSKCCTKLASQKTRKSQEQFIIDCKNLHGDKYDYSISYYEGSTIKVKIKCNTCELIFEQIPESHLRGRGCPECAKLTRTYKKTKTNEKFIKQSTKIHGDKYDYSVTEYVNSRSKVNIKCKKCNIVFSQIANDHIGGSGCPRCSSSLSEKQCHSIFESIMYQKFIKVRPKWLYKLELDGYNDDLKLAFEYQGIQHYEYNEYFHYSQADFERQRERDNRKRELCRENKITLIEVPYMYDYRNYDRMTSYIMDKLLQTKFIFYV